MLSLKRGGAKSALCTLAAYINCDVPDNGGRGKAFLRPWCGHGSANGPDWRRTDNTSSAIWRRSSSRDTNSRSEVALSVPSSARALEQGRSDPMARRVYSTFRRIIDFARANGWINTNGVQRSPRSICIGPHPGRVPDAHEDPLSNREHVVAAHSEGARSISRRIGWREGSRRVYRRAYCFEPNRISRTSSSSGVSPSSSARALRPSCTAGRAPMAAYQRLTWGNSSRFWPWYSW